MSLFHHLAWFTGCISLGNVKRQRISDLSGCALLTFFAEPPGKGTSAATVYLLWGVASLPVAGPTIERLCDRNLKSAVDAGLHGLRLLLAVIAPAWGCRRNARTQWSGTP